MQEEWRDYPKLDMIQVSSLGNIRSFRKNPKGQLLKHRSDKEGYRVISIRDRKNNNVSVNLKVHRMVAEVFLDNSDNLPYVNHINGIKHDNRVCNLEWCSASHNRVEALRLGLAKHYTIRLTNKITKESKVYNSYKEIAEAFDVSISGVQSMVQRKQSKRGIFKDYIAEII